MKTRDRSSNKTAYISLLRNPSFNVESALRVSLKCDLHSHEDVSKNYLKFANVFTGWMIGQ